MIQNAPYLYHAADVSYFSGKARPALSQKSLWYREVLPDYAKIREATGLAYIPVLFTPEGEAWQDTSEILDRLEERHPEPPLFPATPVQRVVAYLIELYGDELGILPAMHYRWNFESSIRKARVDFAFSSGRLDASSRFADRMAGSLPFLGVTDGTGPAIEAHLRELLDTLCAHFETHRFLLGDAMSLADCGLMGPMYGHLFRDAAPQRLLYETAFEVGCWVERMNRPPVDQSGWHPDDALAPTLVSVLKVMADGVALLLDAVSAVDVWADAHAGDPGAPPMAVGLIDSSYRAGPARAAARPYTLWMVQRPLDAYRALSEAERAGVDAVLEGSGWERLLACRPRHRLAKRHNLLTWET